MNLSHKRPKYKAYYDFGAAFLTPLLSAYVVALMENIGSFFPVCLAREGWLIRAALHALQEKQLIELAKAPVYLQVSRTFLFRCLLDNPIIWPIAIAADFKGTFESLLRERFGLRKNEYCSIFSEAVLMKRIKLPRDKQMVEMLFEKNMSNLKPIIEMSYQALMHYLKEVGLHDQTTKPCFLDLGYAGTIQKLLTFILQKDTEGLYFIASKPGVNWVLNHQANMRGVFKEGVAFGEGDYLLDRSLILESFFTSKTSAVIDIRKMQNDKLVFFYGHNTASQHYFQDLQAIFDGALDGVVENFRQGTHFTIAEAEALALRFLTSRDALPRSLRTLLSVDTAINGIGVINSMDHFMPLPTEASV